MMKQRCEEWGHNWLKDLKKNLTPKAHDMIFVIPKLIRIHRIIWLIKDGELKLWKFIERYELRNALDVSIVTPVNCHNPNSTNTAKVGFDTKMTLHHQYHHHHHPTATGNSMSAIYQLLLPDLTKLER